jgi:DNA-binding transcriptional LysR family regulator
MLNLLRHEVMIFQQVTSSGSISGAAEILGVNQPSVSKSLKRLELDLGFKLFVRHREGVRLTKEGKDLLFKLEQWALSEKMSDPMKKLTIACHQSVAMDILPDFVTRLKQRFPAVELSFLFRPSLEVTQLVSQGSIDIGFVVSPVKKNQLIVRPVYKEAVYLWGDNLEEEILIHPDMLYAFRVGKVLDRCILEVPDYEVIAHMVKKGYQGVLPEKVASRHQIKRRGKKFFEVQLSLVVHEDRFTKEVVKFIFDCLKS